MSEVKRFFSENSGRECVYAADFDRVTAERDAALAQESTLARDAANWKRKACESADREHELQQRLTAADELADHNARVSAIAVEDVLLLQKRVDVLEALVRRAKPYIPWNRFGSVPYQWNLEVQDALKPAEVGVYDEMTDADWQLKDDMDRYDDEKEQP